MTMEEAMEKAKKMLALGFVDGVSRAGDTCGGVPPTERIEELANLIMDGAIEAAVLAEVA